MFYSILLWNTEVKEKSECVYDASATKIYELASLASLLTIAVFEKGTSIKRVYQ